MRAAPASRRPPSLLPGDGARLSNGSAGPAITGEGVCPGRGQGLPTGLAEAGSPATRPAAELKLHPQPALHPTPASVLQGVLARGGAVATTGVAAGLATARGHTRGPRPGRGRTVAGKAPTRQDAGPGPYLEGVQGLHQAGELGGVPLLQIVVLLPGVPAGGLPVRQDAVLEPGQAPGAVGVRQVPPSCGQDPARAGVSVTPWAPSRGGRIRGPAPEGVETSPSLGTALGQAQRAGAVTANHHTRPTGTCRCPARRTAWAGSRRRA